MGDYFPVVLVNSQGAYLTDGQYCSSAFWSTDGLHYLFCGHSRDKSEFDVSMSHGMLPPFLCARAYPFRCRALLCFAGFCA
jgi:hypothetical protein